MVRKPRIKVRFNLAKGIHYMKWKVVYPDKTTIYYEPTSVQLVMSRCELKNNQRLAQKIYKGADKEVCAWVLCEEIDVVIENTNQSDITGKRIKYNPRIQPNWLIDETNVDGLKVNQIESVGNCLYVTN